MTDEFDPLNFDTGLINHATGYVIDAFFSPDPKMGPNTLVHLKIAPIEGEEFTEMYNCGPDWRSFDSGVSVDHPKGEQKTFNQNTQIAKLCSQLLTAAGGAEVFKDSGRRDPRRKDFFVGVNARWERMVISKNPTTGEEATRLMPVEFLGFGASEAGQSGQVAQTAHPTAAAPTPGLGIMGGSVVSGADTLGESAVVSNGIDSALSPLDLATQMRIKSLARANNHGDWVDKVMDGLPVVCDHVEVLTAMSDENGLYSRLRV